MNREQILLVALGSDTSSNFSPVQIQKTIFLFQKIVPSTLINQPFEFVPYHYGPFDSDIYRELDVLASKGFVLIENSSAGLRKYTLTSIGLSMASELLGNLGEELSSSLRNLSANIKKLSFTELVNLIYKIYPDMKENSIAIGVK